jgi:outer membrane protein OmpA-like peptidoglycan-associated protein
LAAVMLAAFVGSAIGQDAWQGTAGTLHLQEATTVGKGKLIFSLGTCYSKRSETLNLIGPSFLEGTGLTEANVDFHTFFSRAVLTFGVSDYIEFSAGLPVRNWIMNVENETDNFENITRGGVGDTEVQLKLCAPPPSQYFRVGVLGFASFATGNKERRFTTEETEFGVKGLVTLDFTDVEAFVPTKVHCNIGYRFNRNEELGYGIFYPNNPNLSGFYPPGYPNVPEDESDNFNDLLMFGTGVEFLAKNASLFLEFNWDKLLNADYSEINPAYADSINQSMYTITPGVSVVSESGVGVTFAADFNLNSEDNPAMVNPPDWALYLMISVGGYILPQDQDDDGIEDKMDRCPTDPEDFDGFEDDDGCPDLDNDNDGIKDDVDNCPDLAEDFDGFEDENGCPDLDNDSDGIPDVEDRCPSEPEDFDGFEDSDGCPDVLQDSDNDGVPDDMDKCPLKAEDVDGFQDDDGCPDLDNDLDGILDVDDQCPHEPETFNGFKDEDGCPDERPIEEKFILRGINFETGSAALTPDSYAVLDQVVRSLMAYPEVKIEIKGYTDSVGDWDYNLDLSQRRADAVKNYLVNSGIAADRVVSKGYGEADPVASNKTAGGRAENRRIEFHRLN